MKKYLLAIGTTLCLALNGFSQTGAALRFDGTNDYVNLPPILTSENDFTIEFWLKCDSGLVDQSVFDFWTSTSNYMRFTTNNGSGKPAYQINNATVEQSVVGTSTVFYTGWNHIAITQMGATCSYFFNGNLESTNPSLTLHPVDIGATTFNRLGMSHTIIPRFLKGSIDEFRIWNRALCPEEINTYKNCEINGTIPNLLANYHFNQGIAAGPNLFIITLSDDSGNNNQGSLVNFALNGANSNWVIPGGVASGNGCNVAPGLTYYGDLDGDGYGNLLNFLVISSLCTPPQNYVLNSGDCDDGNAQITPFTVWFHDLDMDGYGNLFDTVHGCIPPPNYVLDSTDCNDNNATLHNTLNEVNIEATALEVCEGTEIGLSILENYNFENLLWSGPGGFSTESPNATVYMGSGSAGYYYFNASSGQCSANDSVLLLTNPLPVVSITANESIICIGGIAQLTASGANSYVWTTGDSTATITANSLFSSEYGVTGTDTNGCFSNSSFSIQVVQPIFGEPAQVMDASCYGQSDGVITIQYLEVGPATQNGYFTYFIITPNNDTLTSPDFVFDSLAAGTYFIGAYEVGLSCNGYQDTVVVNEPAQLIVDAGPDQVVCEGNNSVGIYASGAESYLWNTGDDTFYLFQTPDSTTTYFVTGTSGLCSATDSITVFVNPPPTISFNAVAGDATCYSSSSGTIAISNVVGGLPFSYGYEYILGGNDFYEQNSTGIFTGLYPGTYSVSVEDSSGCESTIVLSVTVGQPSPINVAFNPPVLVVCPGASGNVSLTVSGGFPGYVISGSDSTNLFAGNYFFTVTDAIGCNVTKEYNVLEDYLPSASIIADGSLDVCSGSSVALSVQTGPGSALKFDGIDDAVIGNNPNLPLGNNSRTIEAWIKLHSQQLGSIVNWGTSDQQNFGQSTLFISGGKVHFTGSYDTLQGTTVIDTGVWTHVAATLGDFQMKIFVNGIEDAMTYAFIQTNSNDFQIGQNVNGTPPINGSIEEVRIWDFALSQAQLYANRNNSVSVTSFGLVGLYKFDEGVDTVTVNSSQYNPSPGGNVASPVNPPPVTYNPANGDALLNNGTNWIVSTAPLDLYTSLLWTPGNETGDSILASAAGIYTVLLTNEAGCSTTASITVNNIFCINPYYPPPANGKVDDKIGAELSQLYYNPASVTDTATVKNNIFLVQSDSVYIEVIANSGQYSTLLALLLSPAYGMTDTIDNGINPFIITGKYPINNLKKLDSIPQYVNYVRPYYPPVTSSGVAYSNGDVSLRSDLARTAFGVNGDGIKVGVLSNSFNTIPGKAAIDVANGDLPGAGGSTPVEVLLDYPYGKQSDEGRAMLQIVHDVAPKATLAFRTGFISAGDFAEGIKELQQADCDVIVDDITYITEPFFKEGLVSKAVNYVSSQGVSYFTSAGNFGNKSYEGVFAPTSPPNGFSGDAHDFNAGAGSVDFSQGITLTPGSYTIVMQWEDSIYSLGQLPGARNDLDIYLIDDAGNKLFGFNRKNNWGDPIEVLPFTVSGTGHANILVTRAWGTDNVRFKYILFRGEGTFEEYPIGTSTIVGQANSDGAMTVGAVLYSNTPAYGVNPPTIASFSSTGGTAVNGNIRNKPDFAAPNGVNTSVSMGGVNIDGDAFPNFFGTSAAAPHAAAVAALLIEGKKKFYNSSILSPEDVRTILQSTALDMDVAGFDYNTGHGFIQADSALQTFASPTPILNSLVLADTSVVAGTSPITVTLTGMYLKNQTVVYFNGAIIASNYISPSEIVIDIPSFSGNPRYGYLLHLLPLVDWMEGILTRYSSSITTRLN